MTTNRVHRVLMVFSLLLILIAMAGQSSKSAGAAENPISSSELANLVAKADAGDIDAQYDLGSMYYDGDTVVQNYEEAVKWFSAAAEKGHAEAQSQLGWMYITGKGVASDVGMGIHWYNIAAEQGYSGAQFTLGLLYDSGALVPQDYQLAVKWYTKAGEQGHALAQMNLGVMYYSGEGVTQDYNAAVKWHAMAAEQGFAPSQQALGRMYYSGEGVPQDYGAAFKWYTKAAEQGNLTAQLKLGEMYAFGLGVPQDYKNAARWLLLAAEQGDAVAQFHLGLMYDSGEGVLQDYRAALEWYAKAANQGFAAAQLNLGVIYSKGKGVPEDYIQAYKWYNLSAAQGDEIAQKNREILREKMSPGQIAEAQRLSREFHAKSTESFPEETPSTAKSQLKGYGTGFFITSDGYLLTAYHVVKGADSVQVWKDGASLPSRIIRVDAANDIALLKADVAGVEALPVKSSLGVRSGQEVFTLGFPNVELQGTEAKYTQGHISSLSGIGDDPRLFQISAAVQPGNSGGPLLDAEGQVVGLVVATLDHLTAAAVTGSLPQNVNYALKSSFILSFLEVLPELSGRLSKSGAKGSSRPKIIERSNNAVVMVLSY